MNEPEVIERILKDARTIAVVGLSTNPKRTSHEVASFLQARGYRIIPVNPTANEPILGEKPYPNLQGIPEPFDVVDVFRNPEHVPDVVDDAISAGVKVLWLQLGVVHEEASARAEEAGMTVVMDRCMKIEYRKRWNESPK